MMQPKFSTAYRSILCLNGELPNKDFFNQKIPIIAADGAANKLIKAGVKPSVIIGDLDSLDKTIFPTVDIIYEPHQSKSDFQKALDYASKHHLLPTLIVGVSGGFLDHILNNINIALENECYFYAPPLWGYIFKGSSIQQFTLPINTKLSLFGLSKAKISTQGLKWDLEQAILTFPGINSALNRTAEPQIRLDIIQGNILLLIYEHPIEDKGSL